MFHPVSWVPPAVKAASSSAPPSLLSLLAYPMNALTSSYLRPRAEAIAAKEIAEQQ
jgi:hypothetical protein